MCLRRRGQRICRPATSNQFNAGQTMQINPASGRKRMKARPGRAFASGEAKLARIAAPAKARIAARVSATRKKLRPISERNGRGSSPACVTVRDVACNRLFESSRAERGLWRARPMEAATIQSNESASAASNAASTARFRLPRRMCAIARPTSKGCLVERRVASPLVTGSVSRYSMKSEKQQRPADCADCPAPGDLGERQRRPAKRGAEAFERGRDART